MIVLHECSYVRTFIFVRDPEKKILKQNTTSLVGGLVVRDLEAVIVAKLDKT